MNAKYLESIGFSPNSRLLLEAEVLSACFINPQWMDVIDLTDRDFSGQHRDIFAAMLELHEDNEPIDSVEVWKKTGVSATKIGEIVNTAATSANLPHYSKKLKERILFDLTKAEADRAAARIKGGEDHQAVVADMNDKIESERSRLLGDSDSTEFHAVVASIIQRIRNGEVDEAVLFTGIPWIDRLSKGLAAGDYVILAARPSCGKTALTIQIMTELAIRGVKSLFFSKEMSPDKIAQRMISYCSMANVGDMLRGSGDQSGREIVLEVESDIREIARNVRVISKGITVDSVEREMRSAAAAGYHVVAFDYIQLMECGTGKNRNNDIEAFSRRVKTVLNETGLRGVFLSQLSRECEKDNRAPRLSDLRDSGSIEQDADGVWFLHRKEQKTIFSVAKGRDTGTGGTTLFFDGQKQRFGEISN